MSHLQLCAYYEIHVVTECNIGYIDQYDASGLVAKIALFVATRQEASTDISGNTLKNHVWYEGASLRT